MEAVGRRSCDDQVASSLVRSQRTQVGPVEEPPPWAARAGSGLVEPRCGPLLDHQLVVGVDGQRPSSGSASGAVAPGAITCDRGGSLGHRNVTEVSACVLVLVFGELPPHLWAGWHQRASCAVPLSSKPPLFMLTSCPSVHRPRDPLRVPRRGRARWWHATTARRGGARWQRQLHSVEACSP